MVQKEADAIASMQTIVRSGKTRRKKSAASYAARPCKKETSRVYISCCERAIASDRPAVVSIIQFPRGPGSAEITKAAVARNVSNEGTAACSQQRKDRLVPNREDGGFVGDGESGGDVVLFA